MGFFIGLGVAFLVWLFTAMEVSPPLVNSDIEYSGKVCEANGGLGRVLPSHGNPIKIVCNNGAVFSKKRGEVQ